jgi:hemerythrin-like metal-binding protein
MAKQLIAWTDELATGILWQDLQHASLIEQINTLYAAILAKHGREQVGQIIAFLDTYVRNHFSIEEKYMELYSNPELEKHVKEHASFRRNLEELKAGQLSPGELSAESLCFDLCEWLKTHILSIDRRLGAFLKAQGGK